MIRSVLAVVALLFATPSVATTALINPGFETGDFAGWSVVNVGGGDSGTGLDGSPISGVDPIFGSALVNTRSGGYAAYAVVASSADEFLSLSQTLVLDPGTYRTGFYLGNDSELAFGIGSGVVGAIPNRRLAIRVDGIYTTFTIVPENNITPSSDATGMQLLAGQFETSGGSVTIEFRISGSGTARAGISIDDFFVIPEPCTGALLAFGFICLTVHRRHGLPSTQLEFGGRSRVRSDSSRTWRIV